MPAMPHSAAGPRIEPPVSVPMPPRISPAATPAPVPLLEPAVKCSVFHGLRAGGQGRSNDGPPSANSCVVSLAHQHGAGCGQLHRAGRIGVRDVVAQDLRLAGRRDALGIDDVLQADRNAVQRTASDRRAMIAASAARASASARSSVEQDEGVQLAVQFAACGRGRRGSVRPATVSSPRSASPPRRWWGCRSCQVLLGEAVGQHRFGHAAARLAHALRHRGDVRHTRPSGPPSARRSATSPARASRYSSVASSSSGMTASSGYFQVER